MLARLSGEDIIQVTHEDIFDSTSTLSILSIDHGILYLNICNHGGTQEDISTMQEGEQGKFAEQLATALETNADSSL